MGLMTEAYITGVGAYLPGEPVDNQELAARFGDGSPRDAALSAFVFHRAGLPDPVDLLGAMFVIEGLGKQKTAHWADRLQQSLGLRDDQLSFLRYHAGAPARLRGPPRAPSGRRAASTSARSTSPGSIRNRAPAGWSGSTYRPRSA